MRLSDGYSEMSYLLYNSVLFPMMLLVSFCVELECPTLDAAWHHAASFSEETTARPVLTHLMQGGGLPVRFWRTGFSVDTWQC